MMRDTLEVETGAFLKPADRVEPYVLVLGNTKGGSGKSTTAVHLAIALLRHGYTVGCLDLDARQRSLTNFMANRQQFVRHTGRELPMPLLSEAAVAAPHEERGESGEAASARLREAFAALDGCQFVVVDTPGNDSDLVRLAHCNADTLVTPMNDSYLDLDVIARVDWENRALTSPSVYTRMVWEQNNRRVVADRSPIDWIVMRNRLSHLEPRNKRQIGALLERLGHRVGFRLAPGFGERVVYRELFPRGLTVLDLQPGHDDPPGSRSHDAGRAEVLGLLETIGVAAS